MAGSSVTISGTEGVVRRIIATCVGDDTDGSIPDTVIDVSQLVGRIAWLETDPGTPAPTTLYDVVLENQHGRDVLGGVGADRSATVTESEAVTGGYVAAGDVMTLKVTNQSVVDAELVIEFVVANI